MPWKNTGRQFFTKREPPVYTISDSDTDTDVDDDGSGCLSLSSFSISSLSLSSDSSNTSNDVVNVGASTSSGSGSSTVNTHVRPAYLLKPPSLPKRTLENLAAIVSPPRTHRPLPKAPLLKSKVVKSVKEPAESVKEPAALYIDPLEEELARLDGPAIYNASDFAFPVGGGGGSAYTLYPPSPPPDVLEPETPTSKTTATTFSPAVTAAAAAAAVSRSTENVKRQMSDPASREPKKPAIRIFPGRNNINESSAYASFLKDVGEEKESAFWILLDPVYGSKGEETVNLERGLRNYVELPRFEWTTNRIVAFFSRLPMTQRRVVTYLKLDELTRAVPINQVVFKRLVGRIPVYAVEFKDPSMTLFQRLEVLENMIREFPGHVFNSVEDGKFMSFPHSPTNNATSLDVKEHLEPMAVLGYTGLDRPDSASKNWRKGYLFMVKDARTFKEICENSTWLRENIMSVHLYGERVCMMFFRRPTVKSKIFEGLGKRASVLIEKNIFFRLKSESYHNLVKELSTTCPIYTYDCRNEVIKASLARTNASAAAAIRGGKSNDTPSTETSSSKTFVVKTRGDGESLTDAQIAFVSGAPVVDYIMHSYTDFSIILIALSKYMRPFELYFGAKNTLLENVEITPVSYTVFFEIIRSKRMAMKEAVHAGSKTEQMLKYPHVSKKDRYMYFLNDPAIMPDPSVLGFGFTATKFNDGTFVIRSPSFVPAREIPIGVVALDIAMARSCLTSAGTHYLTHMYDNNA